LAAGPTGGAHSGPPDLLAGSRERAPKGRGEIREGDKSKGGEGNALPWKKSCKHPCFAHDYCHIVEEPSSNIYVKSSRVAYKFETSLRSVLMKVIKAKLTIVSGKSCTSDFK